MGKTPDPDRPSWLTQPCPDWCTRTHHEDDHPEDRIHRDEAVLVPSVVAHVDAVTLRPIPRATQLVVGISQRLDEPSPWVTISEPEDVSRRLLISLETAARLVRALSSAT